MKILFAVLLSFLCLVGRVEGALQKNVIDPISTNSIGSIEKVIKHCLVSGRYLDITVEQGGIFVGVFMSPDSKYSSLEELNTTVQAGLKEAVNGAVTNSFGQNKSQPFIVRIVWAAFDRDVDSDVVYLFKGCTIKLINSSGQFSAPNLSDVKIGLPDFIPYKTPNMVWGKITSSDKRTSETRNDSLVYTGGKLLAIPRDIAVDPGNFETDIRFLDSSYKLFIFDGYGNQVPEKVPSLQIFGSSETLGSLAVKNVGRTTSNPDTISLMVSGGEVGRSYQIESSSDLKNWTLVGNEIYPQRIDDPGNISYSEPVARDKNYFRVTTLNKLPYP